MWLSLILVTAQSPPQPELARLMPPDALVYVEAPGLAALLDRGLEHPVIARLLASPLGQAAIAEAPMTPEAALTLAESLIGEPLLPALAGLTEGGAALAVTPRAGKPEWCLALRARDADILEDGLDLALEIARGRLDAGARRMLEPRREIDGHPAWQLGPKLAFARLGDTLLASSSAAELDRMVARSAQPEPGSSLVGNEEYAAGSADRLAWAWLDLARLALLPGNGLGKLREAPRAPPVQLLLGASLAQLATADRLLLELGVGSDRIELIATATDRAARPFDFLAPRVESPPPPSPLAGPRDVMRASLWRDLEGVLTKRADLFPVETLPKFAEALANLSLFFAGEEVEWEIVPGLSPWLTLVAREVAMQPVPDVVLPAVALVVRMEEPEVMGPRLTSAFQTMVGIINIQAAQERQPSLLLELLPAGSATLSLARYLPPRGEGGVDARYNLVPACAYHGDAFVLGTHVELVRQVVEELAEGRVASPERAGEHVVLDGPTLARLVHENRDALVMNAILEEGKTSAEAEGDIAGLEALLELVDELSLNIVHAAETPVRVELAVTLGAAEER